MNFVFIKIHEREEKANNLLFFFVIVLQIMTFPFVQNIFVSVTVTSITFAVVFLLNYLNKKQAITSEVSRKVVHIGAGTLFLAVRFYDDHGTISKYFNVFPYTLWFFILLWKSQYHSIGQNRYDLVVGTMTRSNRQSELLYGPLFFNIVAILCGTVFYKTVLASLTIAMLTWGDGLAAVIGVQFGSQRQIYRSKTFDGLMTFFLASVIASIVYTAFIVDLQSIHLIKIIVISFLTAIVETLSPSDYDNLTISLSIFLIYSFFY